MTKWDGSECSRMNIQNRPKYSKSQICKNDKKEPSHFLHLARLIIIYQISCFHSSLCALTMANIPDIVFVKIDN